MQTRHPTAAAASARMPWAQCCAAARHLRQLGMRNVPFPLGLWALPCQPPQTAVTAAAIRQATSSGIVRTAAKENRTSSSSNNSSTTVPSYRAVASQSVPASNVFGSGKVLMVVESPTKATKIQKFLGSNYKVIASYGHVRDLPSRSGSVKPDADFEMLWEVSGPGAVRLAEISAASAGVEALVLATDPDREGEAISWHITEELKRRGVLPRPGLALQRVTFTEVTQRAVQQALQQPRQIAAALVEAYLARRALDYLVGFSLSPLLWRRLGGARSAGRVQSVALRLVSERENAIQVFQPQQYWSISADFSLSSTTSSSNSSGSDKAISGVLTAHLAFVDGQKLAQMAITQEQQADLLVQRLWQGQGQHHQQLADCNQQQQQQRSEHNDIIYQVINVTRRPVRRNPSPPLVTSSLQQEAARRLGFSASKTMQVAQQLYEGANTGEGLITYMRTDGINLSAEAVETIRSVITDRFGSRYLPAAGPRVYRSKAKNAQEAHEAIRPTNPALLPGQVQGLTSDQARLYSIIWCRALASQMESAEYEQIAAEFTSPCGTLLLRSSGSSIVFSGYQAVWQQVPTIPATESDPEASETQAPFDDTEVLGKTQTSAAAGDASLEGASVNQLLQQLQEGQDLLLSQVHPCQHETKPPPRYTEASMVKTLEELGIGRPSTYALIMRLLQTRGYVGKFGRSLIPTPLGRLLTAYLMIYFSEYVDVNFTAKVEEQLDDVSAGCLPWKQLMHEFWQPLEAATAAAVKHSTTEVFNNLDAHLAHLLFPQLHLQAAAAAGSALPSAGQAAAAAQDAGSSSSSASPADPRTCPLCGGRLVLKPSRATGGFIGCSNHDSLGCTFGRPLWPNAEEQLLLSDDETNMAAAAAKNEGSTIGSSRVLGQDPATGLSVVLKRGPYGLYVQLGEATPTLTGSADWTQEVASSSSSGGSSQANGKRKSSKGSSALPRASVPRGSGLGWANTTLEDALRLLALPRTLGSHPETSEPMQASVGRFGPYLKHKNLFVALPKDLDVHNVTFDHALELITAKEERLRKRGKDPYGEKSNARRKGKQTGNSQPSSSAANGKSKQTTTSSSNSESKKPKAISGYHLFMQDNKGRLKGGSSGSSSSTSAGSSMLSRIAAAWKALSDAQRAAYSDRARQLNVTAQENVLIQASASANAPVAAPAAGSSITLPGNSRRTNGHASSSSSSRPTRQHASASSSNSNGMQQPDEQHGIGTNGGSSISAAAEQLHGTISNKSKASSNGGGSSGSRQRSPSSTATSSRRSSAISSSSSGATSRRRAAPSLTGYQLFCQQHRGLLASQNPSAKPNEVLSLLAAEWRLLSEQQRIEWGLRAARSFAEPVDGAVTVK